MAMCGLIFRTFKASTKAKASARASAAISSHSKPSEHAGQTGLLLMIVCHFSRSKPRKELRSYTSASAFLTGFFASHLLSRGV